MLYLVLVPLMFIKQRISLNCIVVECFTKQDVCIHHVYICRSTLPFSDFYILRYSLHPPMRIEGITINVKPDICFNSLFRTTSLQPKYQGKDDQWTLWNMERRCG